MLVVFGMVHLGTLKKTTFGKLSIIDKGNSLRKLSNSRNIRCLLRNIVEYNIIRTSNLESKIADFQQKIQDFFRI